ncbi:CDGSH iron-sulfur domain-containing protein [uncultured Ralstonia sp.]|jgi:CDGSH-type Zn-finger protein|uniref:CDGSH iron-sulfur domain-containing protein n=1 Tax=Ralstonia sp. TaxID=54061 RepID=UPI0025D1CD89|nr:CDGSH iron-sulfur domain-containing protein [uncultured Ralstonia sp.]
MADEVVITPRNNGPYHIKGSFRIVTQGGRELAIEGDQVWLCRCGHSLNKPFCDGSHKRVEFDSNLDAPAPEKPA